jgi:hypothetical protein
MNNTELQRKSKQHMQDGRTVACMVEREVHT